MRAGFAALLLTIQTYLSAGTQVLDVLAGTFDAKSVAELRGAVLVVLNSTAWDVITNSWLCGPGSGLQFSGGAYKLGICQAR
ncbi:MAG: hypothetical protein ACLP59_33935 [Bryobacteraceae bacterium]